MRLAVGILAGFLICAAAFVPACACLWDTDTLSMETQRFPGVLELISGKFLRHSRDFYLWRIEDRKKKLEADPNHLQYYDDLAVAYEKVGDHNMALETIQLKDRKKPDQYETLANLGTFYNLHADEIEKGLPYIKRAIAINPNAHFGRERYQIHVVEYVIANMKNGKVVFPINGSNRARGSSGFAEYLDKATPLPGDGDASGDAPVTGILGMMRFANHDNPILLEALGDLIQVGRRSHGLGGGRLLAARAYLQASYVMTDATAREAYRTMAEQVLSTVVKERHEKVTLAEVESQFKAELSEASDWSAAIKNDEVQWIKDGKDADAEFAKKYYNEPRMNSEIAESAVSTEAAPGSVTPAIAAPPQPASASASASASQTSLAGRQSSLWMVIAIGSVSLMSVSTLLYFFAPKRKPSRQMRRKRAA